MNNTKKTAGKTATTGKQRQGWRDTRRKGERVIIDPAMFIKLQAGARMLGYKWSEYLDQLWSGELESLLDYAESETGKRELPFTRQERAALARLEAAAL